MNVLEMRRAMTGTGFEYKLAHHFAALLPQPPRFDVPEPAQRQMYPDLNVSSSKESASEDEYLPDARAKRVHELRLSLPCARLCLVGTGVNKPCRDTILFGLILSY